MNIFIDTEFWEDGSSKPIQLISLALVSESGNELYLINRDFDWDSCTSEWLHVNVKPSLRNKSIFGYPFCEFSPIVREWVVRESGGEKVSFWGYYSDYDWVVFCQMFGRMIDLPESFPKYCLDIKQLAWMMGNPSLPKQNSTEHDALNDARWNKLAHAFCLSEQKKRAAGG
jgi:hypothetical protein